MARQGRHLLEDETRKIVGLLASTDMTIAEIAVRMNRSPGAVRSVNRRYRVRDYAGLKRQWTFHTKNLTEASS
jgi:IS30 family transposase